MRIVALLLSSLVLIPGSAVAETRSREMSRGLPLPAALQPKADEVAVKDPLRTDGPIASSGECTGEPTQLELDVTLSSSVTTAPACFVLSAPAALPMLRVTLDGQDGVDLDLYVRFGAPPTHSAYDCRPYTGSGDEECSFARPKAGSWHVMVDPYSGGGDFTLTASSSTCPRLFDGIPAGGTVPAQGRITCHQTTVPAGTGALVVTLDGTESADLDLYVRFGEPPTTTAFDCRPYTGLSDETCRLAEPAPGEWFIGVHGYEGAGTYTLQVDLREEACEPLTGTIEASTSSLTCFTASAEGAEFVRAEAHGDAPFLLAIGDSPDPFNTTVLCLADRFESDNWCFASGPPDADVYVYVVSYFDFVGFTLEADAGSATAIEEGPFSGSLEGPGDAVLLRVDALADRTAAVAVAGLRDTDLVVRRGGPPAGFEFDCASTTPAPADACTLSPGPGAVYALVMAYSAPAGPYAVLTRGA